MLNKSLIVIFIALVFGSSCRKDLNILKSAGTLNFSADTVYFDTVFTRLPGSPYPRSVNKQFMIRNPYKETVNINAQLMGGSASAYRINIDWWVFALVALGVLGIAFLTISFQAIKSGMANPVKSLRSE